MGGDEHCLRGIFTVFVIVQLSALSSSGSASTVTRIFQGLKVCSVTVLDGEDGLKDTYPVCVFVGVDCSLLFLKFRAGFNGEDGRRLKGDDDRRVATTSFSSSDGARGSSEEDSL